ncbi:hypothetical protein [Novispirillum itersonii]|uniref:hypothetical protein n=1 Tax=Novispirillum itersonii TaxID=189 RepID=UPI00036720A6|nr:hypothetical protein [Novispirillum itersonii]
MSGTPLSLLLPADLLGRLQGLAQRGDKPLAAVLLQAAEEFADRWEDYYQTCDALALGEPERATLSVPAEDASSEATADSEEATTTV